MSRIGLLALSMLVLARVFLFAQTAPDAAADVVNERLQLAVADAAYPVTPGDVYELSFLQGVERITTQVIVDSGYRLNLGVFGTVDARGMTFSELKPEVERIIANAYPRGLPSLNIAAIGLFRVTLAGSVPRTTRVTAWGLSRLTDLIGGHTGAFTSLREVVVQSRDRSTESYDLFRAIHSGDMSQDPLVRPGDTVSFRRRGQTVTVEGEVYEPATYELLSGEGLRELEEFFQGYRPRADTSRLVVERQSGETVRQISIGSASSARGYRFRDGDVLIVPRRVVPRLVVYMEGAVDINYQVEPQEDVDSSIPVYNRVSIPLTAGDTLYSLLVDTQERISPFANIERGYLIRQDDPIPVPINMRQVLYRESEHTDLVLEPFDRIVIPIDQPFVVVTGGVERPGRYPYNPFESFRYYLGLAGIGSDSLGAVADVVEVLDREGNEVSLDETILPGYTISVPSFEGGQGVSIALVAGAVNAPGVYEIVRERTASYYILQAGGVNNDISADGAYRVVGIDGEPRPDDAVIQPGDTIEVERNGFFYNFSRYFPVITTGLGFITTIITIVNALNP